MLQRGVGAGSGAGSAQDEAPQAGALYPEAGREEVVAAQHEAERLHQIVQGPPHCAHATQLDGGGALALRHLLRRGLRAARQAGGAHYHHRHFCCKQQSLRDRRSLKVCSVTADSALCTCCREKLLCRELTNEWGDAGQRGQGTKGAAGGFQRAA